MKLYEGTKRLRARPMTRGEYNVYRDYYMEDPDATLPGYLVEYEDGGKANDSRHVGYISWSPADVFDRTYREVKEMEQEIKAAGADVAPRVTPADIEANIASEHYFTAAHGVDGYDIEVLRASEPTAPLTLAPMTDDPDLAKTSVLGPLRLLTFCVLVLRNGFTVTGESACASPENFNVDIGRKVARQAAIAKMWPLLGFALKQRLHDAAECTNYPLD